MATLWECCSNCRQFENKVSLETKCQTDEQQVIGYIPQCKLQCNRPLHYSTHSESPYLAFSTQFWARKNNDSCIPLSNECCLRDGETRRSVVHIHLRPRRGTFRCHGTLCREFQDLFVNCEIVLRTMKLCAVEIYLQMDKCVIMLMSYLCSFYGQGLS